MISFFLTWLVISKGIGTAGPRCSVKPSEQQSAESTNVYITSSIHHTATLFNNK